MKYFFLKIEYSFYLSRFKVIILFRGEGGREQPRRQVRGDQLRAEAPRRRAAGGCDQADPVLYCTNQEDPVLYCTVLYCAVGG